MTQVHQLYHLQEIDTEIREKKARLGEVLQILKGPPWLIKARNREAKAAEELRGLQSQQNELNLELQSIRNKEKNSERRLYSGKVVNPKELSDLQSEIDSLQRRAGTVEEEMLEIFILMEDAEAEKEGADGELNKAETRWNTESVELQTEQNELALRLRKLMTSRQEYAATLDVPSLKNYENLAQKKKGMAIARLRGDMCLGCRMTVSAQKIKQAKEGKLSYCGGCGRMLYPY